MRRNTGQAQYPKCPAIIFNNSGSMVAAGRLEKTMEIIVETTRIFSGADFYVSDARTGLPTFVAHIEGGWPAYSAPLIPIITGQDYINTMALAAVISEYPVGVHIIDDGDGISDDIAEALHLLKDMKNPAYRTPVILYYVRGISDPALQRMNRVYEHFMKLCPKDSGFNISMYFAAVDAAVGYAQATTGRPRKITGKVDDFFQHHGPSQE
tara:strand:+ start:63 stop:692 length:630 start_codon:yes stop_codon:yes gene_type:complete